MTTMIRLAVPIIILLLTLFAGAVLALRTYLTSPEIAGEPATETQLSTTEGPSTAAEQGPGAAKAQATFDVARIDPQGTSVFAGRAEPNTSVTIMADGQPVGTAQADDNGEWTFTTEHQFANSDPKLALLAGATPKSAPADQTKLATADASKAEPGRKSANSITSHLLKNLEGMVEEARVTKEREAAAEREVAAKTPAPLPAPADTTPPKSVAAVEPAPSVSEPKAGEPETRKSVPVPITFIYNEANFTDDGKKAAALLLEYLQLKHFPEVSLTGHADERGSNEFNLDLSKERLDTVAQYLKENGYKGKLELIPKGEAEPFTGVVRSQYLPEELFQLDRRVELVITQ